VEGRQQLISLGPQAVVVLVDALDGRLQFIQPPELGAEPFVLLGELFKLLTHNAEELMAFVEPACDVVSLPVHGICQRAAPSTGTSCTEPSGRWNGITSCPCPHQFT